MRTAALPDVVLRLLHTVKWQSSPTHTNSTDTRSWGCDAILNFRSGGTNFLHLQGSNPRYHGILTIIKFSDLTKFCHIFITSPSYSISNVCIRLINVMTSKTGHTEFARSFCSRFPLSTAPCEVRWRFCGAHHEGVWAAGQVWTSATDEVSGQLQAPAALALVPVEKETEWVPEPVWTLRRTEKYLVPVENRISTRQVYTCIVEFGFALLQLFESRSVIHNDSQTYLPTEEELKFLE